MNKPNRDTRHRHAEKRLVAPDDEKQPANAPA
jgi:hypothetical protein